MKLDNAGHQSAVIVVFLDIIGVNALADSLGKFRKEKKAVWVDKRSMKLRIQRICRFVPAQWSINYIRSA